MIFNSNVGNRDCSNILITSSGGASKKQAIKLGLFNLSNLVHNDRATYTNEKGRRRLFYDTADHSSGWKVGVTIFRLILTL